MTQWPRAAMARAAISVAGPIALGMATGHLREATLVAFGAMLAVFEDRYRWYGHRLRRMPLPPLAGAAGIVGGTLLLDHGWTTVLAITALAFVSGLLSAHGGLASAAGLQLLLAAVVASGIELSGGWLGAAALFLLGAFVHIALTLLSPHAYRARELLPQPKQGTNPWRYGGWLAAAIGAAGILGQAVDLPRAYWIGVTIALVVRPDAGRIVERAAQRAVGTVVGVGVGLAIMAPEPPDAVLVAAIAVLAALVPLGMKTNFVLITAAITPVVLIKSDLLTHETFSLAGARLLDSLLGCAIALAAGMAFEWEWPGFSRFRRFGPGRSPGRSTSLRRHAPRRAHS